MFISKDNRGFADFGAGKVSARSGQGKGRAAVRERGREAASSLRGPFSRRIGQFDSGFLSYFLLHFCVSVGVPLDVTNY